jgi:tetratricopeptide (TPR) repeat protein
LVYPESFMSHRISVILLFFLIVQVGCEPQFSLHPVVEINYNSSSVDAVYVRYLLNQIENHPEVSDNYIKLSGIYEKQGDINAAIKLLQKGTRLSGGNSEVIVELGKFYLQNGNLDELAVLLKLLRTKDPDNVNFLKLSSGYALLLRDAENVVFFANRALLANPVDDENLYLMASGKLLNKDSITALGIFAEAYKLRKSYANFSKTFDLAINLRLPDQARDYLIDFESSNNTVNCCYQWGSLYNAIGKRDSAKWVLRHCEEPLVAKELLSFEIAKTFYPENTDSVLFYVDRALNIQPQYLQALVLKAKTLDRQGNYDRAIGVYQSAIQMDSTYTLALQGLNNLERKVAYLRLVQRKESVQRDLEILKPLNSRTIN